MKELQYTLVSEGSSDQAFIPILNWLLRIHLPNCEIHGERADFQHLLEPPISLKEKIKLGLNFFPGDLLFVHRDVDKTSIEDRIKEIERAVQAAEIDPIPAICVVPIRMQEAWLLIDEQAIRRAAGNPHGRHPLNLPRRSTLETLPDPKTTLNNLLKTASNLKGRRLRSFERDIRTFRVTEMIEDFSPLRDLTAFQLLESNIIECIKSQAWDKED